MIYFVMICVVIATLLFFVRSEYRIMQMVSMFLILLFFLASLCAFILYFCKSSFNLGIFQRYFQIPSQVTMRLYFLDISKSAVINFLNASCLLFLMGNVFFASSFAQGRGKRGWRNVCLAAACFFILEFLIYSPEFYIWSYSFLYPRWLSVVAIEYFWNYFNWATCAVHAILLLACLGIMIRGIFYIPHIKIYKQHLLILLISYSLLLALYLAFMGRLPMRMVDYSKSMDVVTYRMLDMNSEAMGYRVLPYLTLTFVAWLVVWSLRLNGLRRKMETYSLEVSKSIDEVNMSARVFCHFMKNELLNLQAEIENLEPESEEKQLSIEHCESLYERLEDIHRNVRDNMMNLSLLSLNEVVRETVEDEKRFRPETDIDWTIELPKEELFVFVDREFFRQALVNLLNNAADALHQREEGRKRISVRTLSDSRWGIVEVRDNGCGIPKEDLAHIFTPFFSSKPIKKSWGMGLPLTYKIIKDCGGRIEVESEVGKGTLFRLYLPAKPA